MSTPISAALFWLGPRNAVATRCVQDESNSDSVETIPDSNGQKAIAITFDKEVRAPGSLLTIGLDGDVELKGHKISRNQLQIQLHLKTLEILIRDTSTYRNTRIINTTDPENLYFSTAEDVPRQVVIRHGDPILLSAGGENKELAQFEVIWPLKDTKINNEMQILKQDFVARRRKARFSVTPYETPSFASRYESRVQSPKTSNPWLHRKLKILGAGTFGEVYKTLNMHTGEYFAVKIVRRSPEYASETDWRKAVRKEVKILETLCHPNIVEYYHSRGFKSGSHPIEIFMALYDGSVEDLVIQEPCHRRNSTFLVNVYSQILKALTYIANKGLIHRDVKPANILFIQNSRSSELEQSLRFILADFGLSKEQVHARTLGKGSLLFMAPEMHNLEAQQSHKVDVYSLGVTMLAIYDAGGIVSDPVTSSGQIQRRLQEALEEKRVRHIGPHLLHNPNQRPSAQQIFLQHWPGDEEAQRLNPQESLPRAEIIPSRPSGGNCDLRSRRQRVTKRKPKLMNQNAGGEFRGASETAKLFRAIAEQGPQFILEGA